MLFFSIPIQYLAILLAVSIVLGLCLFFLGFRLLARKRSILTIPTSKIRSAPGGMVEVSGMATGPCTTVAPISGEPCFLYRTTAWRQRKGKKSEWEKVADETLHLPFMIDDSTSQVLVEALGAEVKLLSRFRGEYASTLLDGDDVPVSVTRFLSRHGIAFDCNLRVEECSIKAEDSPLRRRNSQRESKVSRGESVIASVKGWGADPRNPARDSRRIAAGNNDGHDPARNATSSPAPEVIRLASAAAAATREMSQQGKIAAALSRAGIGKQHAWDPEESPKENVDSAAHSNAAHSKAVQSNERIMEAPVSASPEFSLHEKRLSEAWLVEAKLDGRQAEASDIRPAHARRLDERRERSYLRDLYSQRERNRRGNHWESSGHGLYRDRYNLVQRLCAVRAPGPAIADFHRGRLARVSKPPLRFRPYTKPGPLI